MSLNQKSKNTPRRPVTGKRLSRPLIVLFAVFLLLAPAAPCPARADSGDKNKQEFFIESAEYMKHFKETGVTEVRGNVVVRLKDGSIRADEMTVDEKNNSLAAFGRVVLDDDGTVITGTALYYDNDNEYFEMLHPQGKTTAEDIEGDVYYIGERAWGTRDRFSIYKGTFTTCEPTCRNEAHFTAKYIKVYPDSKIIARKAVFFMGSQRVWFMPYYKYSLRDKERYMPQFGYTEEEGWYVKSKYPYLATAAATGYLLLDYMSKKGTGLGSEHNYTSKKLGGNGYNKFWTVNEKDSGRVSTDITQWQEFKIGDKTSGRVNFTRSRSYNIYRDRSRLNRTSLQFNLSRNIPQKRSDSIAYTMTENVSTTTSSNSSLTLHQQYYLPKNFNFDYNLLIQNNQSGTNPEDEEAELRTTLTQRAKTYNLTVKTQKRVDTDGDEYLNDNGYAVNTTLPEVILALDSGMLRRLVPKKNSTLGVQLIHGRFREGQRNDSYPIRRTAVETDLSHTYKLTPSVTLTPTQRYKQYFYHTHDAKYVLENSTSMQYRINHSTNMSFSYNRRQDAGGAPYKKDSYSESNQLNGTLTLQKPKTRFTLSTGYNYEVGQYQTMNMGYMRGITNNSTVDVKTGFNLETDLWQSTVTNLKLSRKNMSMTIGATWNTEKDMELTIAQITTELWRRNGWNFNIRAVYADNHPYPFFREWVATKRRCCTELQFSYNAEKEEYRLNYYLLAFPSHKLGIQSGQEGLKLDDSSFQTQFGGTE